MASMAAGAAKEKAKAGAGAKKRRSEIIRRRGNKWVLFSHTGKVLGKFDTEQQAKDREHEIQAFKHMAQREAVLRLQALRRQEWSVPIRPLDVALEAEGPGFGGHEWEVTIIGAQKPEDVVVYGGQEHVLSKNGRLYSCQGLEESVPEWSNVKVYDNHLSDQEFEARQGMRSVKDELVGVIQAPYWDRDERKLKGTLRVADEALAKKLKAFWDEGILDTIGLSIDTQPKVRREEAQLEGKSMPIIEGFDHIFSVDLVAEPAAGGSFDRLVASVQRSRIPEGDFGMDGDMSAGTMPKGKRPMGMAKKDKCKVCALRGKCGAQHSMEECEMEDELEGQALLEGEAYEDEEVQDVEVEAEGDETEGQGKKEAEGDVETEAEGDGSEELPAGLTEEQAAWIQSLVDAKVAELVGAEGGAEGEEAFVPELFDMPVAESINPEDEYIEIDLDDEGQEAQAAEAAQQKRVAALEAQVARMNLENKIKEARLEPDLANMVRESFKGRTWQEAQVDKMVRQARKVQAKRDGSGRVAQGGQARGVGTARTQERIEVGLNEHDKAEIEFLRLMAGDSTFRDLENVPGRVKEARGARQQDLLGLVADRTPKAYKTWVRSGRPNFRTRHLAEWAHLMLGSDPWDAERLREAVTLSGMTSIIKNTINLLMANDYSVKEEWWASLCRQESVDNIDDVTLVRVYGLDQLSVVTEGAPYTELDWSDDEETASFVKRGNFLGVTLEMLLSDKLNILRTIPQRLANAWYNTKSTTASNVFTLNSATGPVLTDTGALFNATALTSAGGHANLTTGALTYANLIAARTAMAKQTDQALGAGQRLGIKPKYLLVCTDLVATAEQILLSDKVPGKADNDVNALKGKLEIVEVPNWTDTTNWALLADPKGPYPVLWDLSLKGYQVPKLVTADADASGAVFTNDVVRYKIQMLGFRYSSTYDCLPVSDFRGIYKANVAG